MKIEEYELLFTESKRNVHSTLKEPKWQANTCQGKRERNKIEAPKKCPSLFPLLLERCFKCYE